MERLFRFLVWVGLMCSLKDATAQAAGTNQWKINSDIEDARAGDQSLKLDFYLPLKPMRPQLIVWVHGGAWRSGSRKGVPLTALIDDGYALASIDYRLSTQAKFPAQAHDIKAAIRFLRGHANEWNIR